MKRIKTALVLMLCMSSMMVYSQQVIKDINGNTYKTVKIGTQTWMSENLKATKFNDGSPIKLVNSAQADDYQNPIFEPAYYSKIPNKATGILYNIEVVVADKNVCPIGWHIPKHSDWCALEQFLGMSQEDTEAYSGDVKGRGNGFGNKLKDPKGWSIGFDSVQNVGFNAIENGSCWWSSTPDASSFSGDLNLITRKLDKNNSYIELWKSYHSGWLNIRCIKDTLSNK